MLIFSTAGYDTDLSFLPDMYELRLDLRDNCFEIPSFFHTKKTIVTLRDELEGGNYTGCVADKIDFFIDLMKKTDFYIDIEYANLSLIYPYINTAQRKRLIISIHNYSSDIDQILKKIANIDVISDCFFYKFVFEIDSFFDFFMIHKELLKKKIQFTFISTGSTSFFSRVLYKNLSCISTYFAMKGGETAQNQLTDDDVLLYNLQHLTKHTAVGGIIGGSQILKSLGMSFYNLSSEIAPFMKESILV